MQVTVGYGDARVAGELAMGDDAGGERPGALDHRQILFRESDAARNELERDVRSLGLSALTAGLNLSFGALLMLMALSMHEFGSDLTRQLTLAGLSTIGFVIVMVGQTELFTAHTTMSVLPLFQGDTTVRRVAGRWTVMLAANLLGTAGFAAVVAVLGPRLGVVDTRCHRLAGRRPHRVPVAGGVRLRGAGGLADGTRDLAVEGRA